MNFKEKLKEYQDIINYELNKYLIKEECYEKVLNESTEYSLMSNAKRLRPILMLESYRLFRDDYERCLPYAVAIEMTHTFSLIHDDLPGIDDDDYRRGRLTNHKKYNEATAILTGDSLLNRSYMIIAKEIENAIDYEDAKRKTRILNEFSKAIDNMIVGEYLDTECEGKQIKKEELDYIHNNKTAAFFKYCVRAGSILAGATEDEIENLTNYAEKIGLEFQIRDDILSEIGDAKIMGKPVGNDKELKKATYVTIFGLEKAEKYLESITSQALESIKCHEEKADFLRDLAIYIKDRNK